jgi:hypothetical protein
VTVLVAFLVDGASNTRGRDFPARSVDDAGWFIVTTATIRVIARGLFMAVHLSCALPQQQLQPLA